MLPGSTSEEATPDPAPEATPTSSKKKKLHTPSKAEIVSNATEYIKALQSLKLPKESLRKMRSLRRQNKRLKALLFKETGLDRTMRREEDFLRLGIEEIEQVMKEEKEKNKGMMCYCQE